MQTIFQWVFIIIFSFTLNYANESTFPKPILQKGEKRFQALKNYTLDDFHFNWHINYFDIVTYEVDPSLKLKKDPRFETVLDAGTVKMDKKRKKELDWLTKAILKKSYFWKIQYPMLLDYRFTSLRFLDEKGRFKAIGTLHDILDMLGEIDTEAELHLWIFASEQPYWQPYSYKKIGTLYRVRFRLISECSYEERFRYYNREGDAVKNKKIKAIRKTNCEEPVM